MASERDAGSDEPKPKRKGLPERPVLLVCAGAVFLGVLVAGVLWWLHTRDFESTDDAFIDAHIVRLAPQIAGRVTGVWVNDKQLVHTGQPLI